MLGPLMAMGGITALTREPSLVVRLPRRGLVKRLPMAPQYGQ